MTASTTLEEFTDLLAASARSAVHLEMRDVYAVSDPSYDLWLKGESFDRAEREAMWKDILAELLSRGVVVRRARIVSEPVTDYIAYEHAVTSSTNLAAGELVRWLPRRGAADLALPGTDFWLFDDAVVQWNHFAGDGTVQAGEVSTDAAAVRLCAEAFEAVWERGTDHSAFRLIR
ncbi:hypothetical protein EDD29_5754 [Actinocorallia herbida]|uniref:DUF6879 domain-containing protein n=1 Tax=Actinocorallia herbida TaxID=58109 RepID=A0A3N1D3M2_9ACTN|nr:DUF6879 family protein [Actinocorallia herbida]ROO88096.1 hypothetical protein EDD29_5754 [Actinocorallia herbida]